MSEEEDMLSLFRGIPDEYASEPKLRAKPLGELIEHIRKTCNIEAPRIEVLIIKHWREIVGPDKAHRCKPNKIIRNDTLLITTMNTTLRAELQFEREKILSNLHRLCGNDLIRDIVVR